MAGRDELAALHAGRAAAPQRGVGLAGRWLAIQERARERARERREDADAYRTCGAALTPGRHRTLLVSAGGDE